MISEFFLSHFGFISEEIYVLVQHSLIFRRFRTSLHDMLVATHQGFVRKVCSFYQTRVALPKPMKEGIFSASGQLLARYIL